MKYINNFPKIIPYLYNRIFFKIQRYSDSTYNKYKEALKNLKDIHKGRRGFVIGNGPSLNIDDLELINNEITFASNKIYLAFDDTN